MGSVWKRGLLSLLIVGLVAIALFPCQLLSYVADRLTTAYFQKSFGATLTVDRVEWKKGSVVFSGGKLAKSGYYDATFDCASFKPHLSLITREIGGCFHVSCLHVIHQKKEPIPTSRRSSRSSRLFTPDVTLLLRDCKVTMTETAEECTLDLTHHYQHGKTVGNVVLRLEGKPLEILFSSDGECIEVATTFQNHPLPPLQHLCNGFVSHLLPPHLIDWEVTEGVIDGRLVAELNQGEIERCVGNLHLQKIKSKNALLAICATANECGLQFEIEKSRLPDWSAKLSLSNGSLGLEEQTWKKLGEIRDVETTLEVIHGQLDRSMFRGAVLGLEGEITFDWHRDHHLMEMVCAGRGDQIVPLLPLSLQKGFHQAFGSEHIGLGATLHRKEKGLLLEGNIDLSGNHNLTFGCEFGGDGEVSLPALIEAEPLFEALREQFCLSGKWLGYFRGKQLPLEKFLAPFLLDGLPLALSGLVDVEGTFDKRYIVLSHTGDGVGLRGESFELLIPGYAQHGVHSIDLKRGTHVGYLPFDGASYIQHSCRDLTLKGMKGVIQFDGNQIQFQGIETVWNGLKMEGGLDLTIQAVDAIDIHLSAHCLEGSIASGKQLLSHFSTTLLDHLPLKGTFSVLPGDILFEWHLNPKATLTKGWVAGTTHFACDPIGEGSCKFAYDTHAVSIDALKWVGQGMGKQWVVTDGQLECVEGKWMTKAQLASKGEPPYEVRGVLEKGDFALYAKPWQLQGRIENRTCFIEEIKWGEGEGWAQISSDLTGRFLLAHPQMGRCEFIGKWDREKQGVRGEVTVEALDLEQLVPPEMGHWGVTGTFSGMGNIGWEKGEGLALQIEGEHRNLRFGSLDFGDGDALTVRYASSTGLHLEGLEALGQYRLGSLHYDPVMQHAYFEGFDFQFLPEKLPWLAEVAGTLFPGKISQKTIELLAGVKQTEPLKGRLWIDLTPEMVWLHLKLHDGSYYFEGQPWQIKDFALTYDPYEIGIKTGLILQNVPSILHLKTDSQTLSRGELVLQEEGVDEFLVATWNRHPQEGYLIEEARGTYGGVTCDLKQMPGGGGECFSLQGTMLCRPKQTISLLPDTTYQAIKRLNLDGEYHLRGRFDFPKYDLMHPEFRGEVRGCDCKIGTVTLANLKCHCVAVNERIELSDIAVRDWSGNLFCDRLLFHRGHLWQVEADHIAIRDFRPSRLDSSWTKRERGERSPFRALFISSCELNHLEGYLSDKNSFMGSGQLSFTNLQKRTFFSNLMMIPTEITARIGLDLTNLVPVRGTVHYQIGDGRLYLNEFQDVYSDAKRSRFYLADNKTSYVALDGSLHLCVKMKQYNLLMKLAELFTVTIKGTLKEPQYLFTSQSVDPYTNASK